MNWDEVSGKWTQMMGNARSHWGELTDDELQQVEGDRMKMEGLLQEKYGQTKEEARDAIDNWLAKNG